ncbi:MAG: hypothetical protein ACOCZK_05925 [Planctomycetota bacterium]
MAALLVLLIGMLPLAHAVEGDEAGDEADDDGPRPARRIIVLPRLGVPAELPIEPGSKVPPGAAEPVRGAAAFACEVHWDVEDSNLVSRIVIEPGSGPRRRAWVATFTHAERRFEVAHAGTAFIDAAGAVHIDCRDARVAGPRADQWSPDSFAITPSGRVRVIDDMMRANTGTLLGERIHPRDPSPDAPDEDAASPYRRALLHTRLLVEGAI